MPFYICFSISVTFSTDSQYVHALIDIAVKIGLEPNPRIKSFDRNINPHDLKLSSTFYILYLLVGKSCIEMPKCLIVLHYKVLLLKKKVIFQKVGEEYLQLLQGFNNSNLKLDIFY